MDDKKENNLHSCRTPTMRKQDPLPMFIYNYDFNNDNNDNDNKERQN